MTTISSATLVGLTSDGSIDETTRLFRRLADRGDDKGGKPDGVVSAAEAKAFIADTENTGAFHIKTTKNSMLDVHEQIGAIEFEIRRLEANGQKTSATYTTLSSTVARLVQSAAKYDQTSIEAAYKAKAGTTTLPAGKLVGQYENIFFVSKNAATASEAQAYVKKFMETASQTRTGRYILELMVKQDSGKPIVITLDGAESSDSGCYSHENIHFYYNDTSINDPVTMLIHEMAHSVGYYWAGDLTIARGYLALYSADTNLNDQNDALEFESMIKAKRPYYKDPFKNPLVAGIPGVDFQTFDDKINVKTKGVTGIGLSYSEHVATFFEQAHRLERGLPLRRMTYDPPNPDELERQSRKPNPNLRGMPGPDEFRNTP